MSYSFLNQILYSILKRSSHITVVISDETKPKAEVKKPAALTAAVADAAPDNDKKEAK